MLDAARIQQQGRDLRVPFRTAFVGVGAATIELDCVQILRLLPGKRVVCLALLDGRQVIVKLFVAASGAKRHYQRELTGVELFARAGVMTPKLLQHGAMGDRQGYALVTEYVENSGTLLQRWPDADDGQRLRWLKASIPLVSALHQVGAIQQDIHLDNFLLGDDSVWLIDGDGVQINPQNKPLERAQRVDNLALYLAQLECRDAHFVPELLADYNACHSGQDLLSDHEFQSRLQTMRYQRASSYAQKVMRDCSEVRMIKSFSRFVAYRRELDSTAWRDWLAQLDQSIESGRRLKDGNSATVALCEFSGQQLVVKRYNIKGLGHRLSRFARASRAAVSWQNGHILDMVGIDTPTPLAVVEERIGPFRGRAFLVTEYSAAPGASEYYDPAEDGRQVDKVHQQGFESLFRAMRTAHISHGDFKASNLLVDDQGVQVIDLDSMLLHDNQQSFDKAFERDQQRFLRNWPEGSSLYAQFRALVDRARKDL